MIAEPNEVAADHLGVDHVDDYDTELVLAGMREFYGVLETAQLALTNAGYGTGEVNYDLIREALVEVENALAVLEERS